MSAPARLRHRRDARPQGLHADRLEASAQMDSSRLCLPLVHGAVAAAGCGIVSDAPEILVLAEAAALMRVSESTLRGWAEKGLIPGERFGVWRFRRSSLLGTMDSPRVNKAPEPEPEEATPVVRAVTAERGRG